jgi:hypothetical protein
MNPLETYLAELRDIRASGGKSPAEDVSAVAAGEQVRRYVAEYGLVHQHELALRKAKLEHHPDLRFPDARRWPCRCSSRDQSTRG